MRSRSLVYIVIIIAEGIQENVSVAAICPDALPSTYTRGGKGHIVVGEIPHSGESLHCFNSNCVLPIFAALCERFKTLFSDSREEEVIGQRAEDLYCCKTDFVIWRQQQFVQFSCHQLVPDLLGNQRGHQRHQDY